MNWHRLNKDQVLTQAGEELNRMLACEEEVLLLFSGGSALKLLNEVREERISERLTIIALDERYSDEPHVNNTLQIKATRIYPVLAMRGARLIELVPTDGESLAGLSKRFEEELREWRRRNPGGKVVATLGIGTDGHIAGMSPYPHEKEKFEELFMGEKWVVGYKGNLVPAERVTVTWRYLWDEVIEGLVYVVGEEKREAMEGLMDREGEIWRVPARGLWQMKRVEVFTDIGS